MRKQLLRSVVFAAVAALPAEAQSQAWQQQFGSPVDDRVSALASDGADGVFASGATFGALASANAGGPDAWLARRDANGAELWIRQFGTAGFEAAEAMAPDASGGVYVGGFSDEALGGPNAGESDVWLARYDGAGVRTWIRQFGTSAADSLDGAAPDGAGGVFVCGDTDGNLGGANAGGRDGWLARYSSTGAQLWARHFGSSSQDAATALAPDGVGGVFVCGGTDGDLGGAGAGGVDVWLARYDAAGNQLWIRKLGSSALDFAAAATMDGAGGVIVAGWTYGDLGGPNDGEADAWLARYDASGNHQWTRQFGTTGADIALALTLDASGHIAVSGNTDGDLATPNAGPSDAWIASYATSGTWLWVGQFGSNAPENSAALASDSLGGLYVAGSTFGDLAAPSAGSWDAWAVRYAPPPIASYCTAGTTSHGCAATIDSTGSPSASAASGFVLAASSVEGQRQGLFFYSLDNSGFAPLPWGPGSTSYLCVKPPTQRAAPQMSGGTNNACDGVLALDWNTFRATHPTALGSPFAAGQRVFAQAWFRDPPSPKSTALSNALTFVVQP
jgi:hypothetical protein